MVGLKCGGFDKNRHVNVTNLLLSADLIWRILPKTAKFGPPLICNLRYVEVVGSLEKIG